MQCVRPRGNARSENGSVSDDADMTNRDVDRNDKEETIRTIEKDLKEAREILENANFFMGRTEETTIPNITKEDIQTLQKESASITENQKITNLVLMAGSSFGLFSGFTTLTGLAFGVAGTFAVAGGGAAVAGVITSLASFYSRSQHQSSTEKRIRSIVEKFHRLINFWFMITSVSNLCPGENAIENDLRRYDISKLRNIRTQVTKVLSVLSNTNEFHQDKDLEYILQQLKNVSSILNAITEQLRSDTNGLDHFAVITVTAQWCLDVYKKASPKCKSLLQFSEKIAIVAPDIINGLAKIEIVSGNCYNLLGTIKTAQLTGEKVVETIGKEVAEETASVTTHQVGKKLGGKICEEAAEQITTGAGKAGKKIVEEAAEGGAAGSAVLSANKVKFIRAGVTGIAIAGVVVDGITLKNAIQNFREGSPTKFAAVLESLADFLILFVK